jgi:beta-glucosidase-like glycosyl hydrolase
MALTDQQKQDIKEYLKENLTFTNVVVSDLYGINPDQMTLNILLEEEVIATTTMNPSNGY